MLDKEWTGRVRDATDIVEVIGRAVDIKKQGKGFVGLCPFHGERTPSFTVTRKKGGFYHCFGCGEHGDAIDFLMRFSGVGFLDAVSLLAQEAAIPLPESGFGKRREGKLPKMLTADPKRQAVLRATQEDPDVEFTPEQIEAMRAANDLAQDVFASHLETPSADLETEARKALAYLEKTRGIDRQTLRRFGAGYAPEQRDGLWKRLPQALRPASVRAGLVTALEITPDGKEALDPLTLDDAAYLRAKSFSDRFRGRVTFPIRDGQGKIAGFAGRSVPPEKSGGAKYLNTPSTALFSKGSLLYGLFESKASIAKTGSVTVVEGYLDVVALAQAGVENVVASMGTACTAEQVGQLFDLCAELVFCFDGDAAGKKAMERVLQVCLALTDDRHRVKFMFLPDGEDPDTYVRRIGREAFERERIQALPIEEVAVNGLRAGLNLLRDADRAELQGRANALLAQMPPGFSAQKIADAVSAISGGRVKAQVAEVGLPSRGGLPNRSARLGTTREQATGDRDSVGPAWLRHLEAVVGLAKDNPGAAKQWDLLGFAVRMASMLEVEPSGSDQAGPWSDRMDAMLRTLGDLQEAQSEAGGGEPAAVISAKDQEDLVGAMRQTELQVLDVASVICMEKEGWTDREKAAQIKSLHVRKAELMREAAQSQKLDWVAVKPKFSKDPAPGKLANA